MEKTFYLPYIITEQNQEDISLIKLLQYHLFYLKKQYIFLVMKEYLINQPEVKSFTIYLSHLGLKEKNNVELDINVQMRESPALHRTKEFNDKKHDNIYTLLYQLWEIHPENIYQDLANVEISLENLDLVQSLLLQNDKNKESNSITLELTSNNLEQLILPDNIHSKDEFENLYLLPIQDKIDFLIQQAFIATLAKFFNDNIEYDMPDLVFKVNHYQHFEIEYPEEIPFARTFDGIELNKAIQALNQQSSIIFSSILPIDRQLINHTNFHDKIPLILGEHKTILFDKLKLENSMSNSNFTSEHKPKIKI